MKKLIVLFTLILFTLGLILANSSETVAKKDSTTIFVKFDKIKALDMETNNQMVYMKNKQLYYDSIVAMAYSNISQVLTNLKNKESPSKLDQLSYNTNLPRDSVINSINLKILVDKIYSLITITILLLFAANYKFWYENEDWRKSLIAINSAIILITIIYFILPKITTHLINHDYNFIKEVMTNLSG